jgi:hypothetical protein
MASYFLAINPEADDRISIPNHTHTTRYPNRRSFSLRARLFPSTVSGPDDTLSSRLDSLDFQRESLAGMRLGVG